MTRTHKLVNLVGISLPFVGLMLAIVVLWERMVGPTELAILAVGYVLTGAGITVGYHRLFTHRSFETYRGVRYTSPSSARWPSKATCRLGLRPPEAPPVLRRRRATRTARTSATARASSAAVRGLWHAHTGWLFSAAGPRRSVALREGPDAGPRPTRDREALPAARALLSRLAGDRRAGS